MQLPPTGRGLRVHVLWSLALEVAFFVAVLALAGSLSANAAALRSVASTLGRLRRAFAPLAALHPWYRLALAIFLHNARPFALLALAAAGAAVLGRTRRTRRLAGLVGGIAAAAAIVFWFANVGAAGLVVGVVSRVARAAPLAVWATLLPHGVFELFALSWAMALPLRLAWLRLDRRDGDEVWATIAPALWPGAPLVLALLALAAVIEAGASPLVLHLLVPGAGPTLPQSTP